MKRYVVEFIGTFFFALTIGCVSISPGSGVIAPLAIGLILAVLVYAGGHVSGGHYNPAVTLGVWMRGGFSKADVLSYWLSQCFGAFLAALVVGYMKNGPTVSPLVLDRTGPALLAEFLFTFGLVYVVLNVAKAKSTSGNNYFGLAIGLFISAAAFAIGSISGCVLNPAIMVGVSAMGLLLWSNFVPYLVAQIIGAGVAATVFKVLQKE